jgi:hypothetical protein
MPYLCFTFYGAKGPPSFYSYAGHASKKNSFIAGVRVTRSRFSLRTGSLKIRPPEFTPAAWVRDMRITRFKSEKQRLAFHVKHWPNAGGRIFNEPSSSGCALHHAAAVQRGLCNR